ncbi:hypothetical protein [Diaphorobacter nitroreducens]|uniref:hypothetical protein n=1 Tax=Diaphorobacter nitroreducens TaxID=164759 RepID=UPI0011E4CD98|nr:hypothetical protein [Diaphorobacter nitroreducens]
MKALALLAASIALAGCATQQTQSNANIGFRGATIGSPPLPGMKQLEKWQPSLGMTSREISDAYSMPNEPKTLGSLTIKEVTYEYFNQKLFRIEVDLWTETQARCPRTSELIAALESQYGISMIQHQADYIKPQFLSQWRGSQAWVTYMCQPWNSTNSIVIESPALRKEVEDRLKAIRSSIEHNESKK